MENRKAASAASMTGAVANSSERRIDGAYGFSLSIALGLVLFIGGLVISVALGMSAGTGLLFGIPLMLAGLVIPLFMMREHFSQQDVKGACPDCGSDIHTTEATVRINCPSCKQHLTVQDAQFTRAK
jgi:predicted RNA-binding Zn-ribbon protein involved in translation (DUF1610 family)